MLCENFLYRFKAARRAARAAATARSPPLPLALPLRRRQTPVGWRESIKLGPLEHTASFIGAGGASLLPLPGLSRPVRTRQGRL